MGLSVTSVNIDMVKAMCDPCCSLALEGNPIQLIRAKNQGMGTTPLSSFLNISILTPADHLSTKGNDHRRRLKSTKAQRPENRLFANYFPGPAPVNYCTVGHSGEKSYTEGRRERGKKTKTKADLSLWC